MDSKKEYVEHVVHVSGERLVHAVQKLLKEFHCVHMTIARNGKELISFPITYGVIAFWVYPLLSILTMYLFVKSEYTIRILATNP